MGWSCRADAARVMDKWTRECIRQTGTQNVYKVNGKEYFWEIDRVEHEDGSITGEIFDMRGQEIGKFLIAGDGTVIRGIEI